MDAETQAAPPGADEYGTALELQAVEPSWPRHVLLRHEMPLTRVDPWYGSNESRQVVVMSETHVIHDHVEEVGIVLAGDEPGQTLARDGRREANVATQQGLN